MSDTVRSETFAGLSTDADGDDTAGWPVDRLVDHIVLTHHAYIRWALPRIAADLSELVRLHGAPHPELAVITGHFDALGRELLRHMMKEERVLFPYIRELAVEECVGGSPFGTVENPIRMMEREHEEARELMNGIRTLSAGYTAPADACAAYRACLDELARFERDFRRHVRLEDHVLFPKAVELETARR